MDALIAEVVDDVKLVSAGHQFSYQSSCSLDITADREKIGSVLSNLIRNAVKYSPKGGLIDVRCHADEQEVLVSVADEGMGIREQDINKIFERYYRVQTDSTSHIAGFGIGLYLSAEIVKRHDGRIWVESSSGSGSTFYFSLPRLETG
jgi:two-component system, OmpR family, sensor histidine kinase VicK